MIDVNGQQMFACDECPIVKQLERRLLLSIEFPEYGDFQFDHCACDKVGDEFFSCGYCEDAWVDRPKIKQKPRQERGRAYRRKMTAKKNNRRLNLARSRYADYFSISVEWGFLDGRLQPVGKYVKTPKKSDIKTYWKNYSNRVIRRGACMGSGKGGYKKAFEYWWTIY